MILRGIVRLSRSHSHLLAIFRRQCKRLTPDGRNIANLVINLVLVRITAGIEVREGNTVLGPTLKLRGTKRMRES